jgi:3-hydroxyacyl-[acyl-carrier-protein] dehydratase
MSLLQGFYVRDNVSISGASALVAVRMIPDHCVYEGHFPGSPVAPGAAITQMVIDEATELLDDAGAFAGAQQIKFLAVLDPNTTETLLLDYTFSTRGGLRHFACIGRNGEKVFFKFNGAFL